LLQRLGIIGISLILIYIPYRKKEDRIKGKALAAKTFPQSTTYLKKPRRKESTMIKWALPPAERWKLNVDGSFSLETRSGGAGMIL
jgi:hypothetical protein